MDNKLTKAIITLAIIAMVLYALPYITAAAGILTVGAIALCGYLLKNIVGVLLILVIVKFIRKYTKD